MKKHIRRTFAGLAAAGVLCAALPAVQFSAAQTLAGDVNTDGAVTQDDVAAMQQYLLGKASLSQAAFLNADLTGDGKTNILDMILLKKAAAPAPVSNTVYLHLKGSSIAVEGDDNKVVEISGTTARITASGIYYVDGSLDNGQIYVETAAEDVGDVEIVLTDVTMTNSDKSCICTSANSGSDKTKITLNGTSTLTDTAAAAYTESGVIFTNNKLTFTRNSTGTLQINSCMNAAVNSEKKINLNGGSLIINTADPTNDTVLEPDADGIKSDKNIEIEGGTITVDASGDGIKTDAALYVYDGEISVKAGNDAMQAATELAVSGGSVTASGDRGLRLAANGLLNITGGTVLATATDYQVNGNEVIDMTGSTQTIMLLDMAAQWKKSSAVTVDSKTYTANKKYNYVLVSDSSLSSSGSCTVAIGGSQAKHSTDATGTFQNTGIVTEYKAVELLDGGTVTAAEPAIVYGSSGVTLYDASGSEVSSLSGITVSGKTATVTAGGTYSVKGSASEAQLIVDTADLAVELDFEGLNLSNSSVAPVYVANVGDEVTISVKNGTENTISDGTTHTDTYVNSDNETVTVNGALFSRDDLKIKGKGTLTVNGNYEDGIVCKDDLKLWNGNITVNAADDGIRGNGSVRIGDPEDTDYSGLNVDVHVNNGTTGGDGIKSTDTETGKGYVTISGGTVNIEAYCDGIQAEQEFTMNGGDVTIATNAGSSYGGTGSSGSTNPWGGGMGGGQDGNSNKIDISAKGIKAVGLYDTAGTTWQSGGNLTINGGTLQIDSADDSLHCSGNMLLNGGKMSLSSADDGAHSDHDLTIGSGSAETYDDVVIYVNKAYEGMEGMNILQNSGSVIVNSTDDAYNAAGGADGSGSTSPGGWFQGGMDSNSGNYSLEIKGGLALANVTDGDHDGFDSNGSLTISGGIAISNGTDAFDSVGTLSHTGGVFVTQAGSGGGMGGGMMGGGELSANVTASCSASAGTRISLCDGTNVIVSFLAGKNVTSLKAGCSSSSARFYTGGTVSGGTAIAEGMGTQTPFAGGTLSGGTSLN